MLYCYAYIYFISDIVIICIVCCILNINNFMCLISFLVPGVVKFFAIMHLSMLRPTPLPCTGIGGDLTHRMGQIPNPSITIQCQIPTLYIHTRICAGTRANACAGQKPHPWGVISWRIPYQAPPLSPTGGGWGVTLIGA